MVLLVVTFIEGISVHRLTAIRTSVYPACIPVYLGYVFTTRKV